MATFDPFGIYADIGTLRDVLDAFGNTTSVEGWQTRTGDREKDWTTHQVLAHLLTVATVFNRMVDAALNDQHDLLIGGLSERTDLAKWNAEQIAANTNEVYPSMLIAGLLSELETARQKAARMSPDEAEKTAFLRIYNRPAPAYNFLDWQLSHAGIVHGAQLTRGIGQPPLWKYYPDAMIHRQVERFLRHFSWAYWPTYAPDGFQRVMNMYVEGDNGGVWHLAAMPDGGGLWDGEADEPDYRIIFAAPEVLFGIFTYHLSMQEAIEKGWLRIEGDAHEAVALLKLFAPSPPKQRLGE